MRISRSGVFNVFDLWYFQLTMGLLGCRTIKHDLHILLLLILLVSSFSSLPLDLLWKLLQKTSHSLIFNLLIPFINWCPCYSFSLKFTKTHPHLGNDIHLSSHHLNHNHTDERIYNKFENRTTWSNSKYKKKIWAVLLVIFLCVL